MGQIRLTDNMTYAKICAGINEHLKRMVFSVLRQLVVVVVVVSVLLIGTKGAFVVGRAA